MDENFILGDNIIYLNSINFFHFFGNGNGNEMVMVIWLVDSNY